MSKINFKKGRTPLSDQQIESHMNFDQLMTAYTATSGTGNTTAKNTDPINWINVITGVVIGSAITIGFYNFKNNKQKADLKQDQIVIVSGTDSKRTDSENEQKLNTDKSKSISSETTKEENLSVAETGINSENSDPAVFSSKKLMQVYMAENRVQDFINMNKVLFLIAIIFCFSCKKKKEEELQDPIPDVPVSATVNMDLPSNTQLHNKGGWLYIDGGNKGIFLVHNYDDEFFAYDRTCTYKPYDACAQLVINESEIYLQCGRYDSTKFVPCCDSRFNFEGFPMQGPASRALKKYFVSRGGNNLYISN